MWVELFGDWCILLDEHSTNWKVDIGLRGWRFGWGIDVYAPAFSGIMTTCD